MTSMGLARSHVGWDTQGLSWLLSSVSIQLSGVTLNRQRRAGLQVGKVSPCHGLKSMARTGLLVKSICAQLSISDSQTDC